MSLGDMSRWAPLYVIIIQEQLSYTRSVRPSVVMSHRIVQLVPNPWVTLHDVQIAKRGAAFQASRARGDARAGGRLWRAGKGSGGTTSRAWRTRADCSISFSSSARRNTNRSSRHLRLSAVNISGKKRKEIGFPPQGARLVLKIKGRETCWTEKGRVGLKVASPAAAGDEYSRYCYYYWYRHPKGSSLTVIVSCGCPGIDSRAEVADG